MSGKSVMTWNFRIVLIIARIDTIVYIYYNILVYALDLPDSKDGS